MPGPDGSVYLNTGILDCKECQAMSHGEYKWQMLKAAMHGEANHMATHMAFGIACVKAKWARKGKKP